MKVSEEINVGCGVTEHGEECLCDVIIVTPITVTVRDAVNDMWCGREICDIRGYGVPWTDETITNYLTDLLRGHDAWIASDVPQTIEARSDYDPTNTVLGWKQIRESVRPALSGTDPKPPVEVVLQSLGFTAEEFIRAATTGKASMDIDTLKQFEIRVLEGVTSLAGLARDFNISAEIAGNLFKYWNVPFSPLHKDIKGTKVQRQRLKELVLEGIKPNTISKILYSEYGYKVSRHSVSKSKRRILDKQKEGL